MPFIKNGIQNNSNNNTKLSGERERKGEVARDTGRGEKERGEKGRVRGEGVSGGREGEKRREKTIFVKIS